MKQLITLGVIVMLALAGLVGYLLYPEINTLEEQIAESPNLGGFGTNHATTTSATQVPDLSVLRTGSGKLVGFVVTLAGTASMDFYNATTTDVTKRTGNRATSTIQLAYAPGSLVAGVYTYDTGFTDGLLIDFGTGTKASTTILWE